MRPPLPCRCIQLRACLLQACLRRVFFNSNPYVASLLNDLKVRFKLSVYAALRLKVYKLCRFNGAAPLMFCCAFAMCYLRLRVSASACRPPTVNFPLRGAAISPSESETGAGDGVLTRPVLSNKSASRSTSLFSRSYLHWNQQTVFRTTV